MGALELSLTSGRPSLISRLYIQIFRDDFQYSSNSGVHHTCFTKFPAKCRVAAKRGLCNGEENKTTSKDLHKTCTRICKLCKRSVLSLAGIFYAHHPIPLLHISNSCLLYFRHLNGTRGKNRFKVRQNVHPLTRSKSLVRDRLQILSGILYSKHKPKMGGPTNSKKPLHKVINKLSAAKRILVKKAKQDKTR